MRDAYAMLWDRRWLTYWIVDVHNHPNSPILFHSLYKASDTDLTQVSIAPTPRRL